MEKLLRFSGADFNQFLPISSLALRHHDHDHVDDLDLLDHLHLQLEMCLLAQSVSAEGSRLLILNTRL